MLIVLKKLIVFAGVVMEGVISIGQVVASDCEAVTSSIWRQADKRHTKKVRIADVMEVIQEPKHKKTRKNIVR